MHPTATKAKQQEWYATRELRSVRACVIRMPVHWTGEAIASDWAADRGVDEVRGVLAGELFEPTAGRRGHVRATTRELNDIRITETTMSMAQQLQQQRVP